jgi:hypothetical protein
MPASKPTSLRALATKQHRSPAASRRRDAGGAGHQPRRTAGWLGWFSVLAACLTALGFAGPCSAGRMEALLACSATTWPGEVLRLAVGPASGGAGAAPAVGDVTGDGHADVVVGSAYGDLVLYAGTGGSLFGPPEVLLSEAPSWEPLRLVPAAPCLVHFSPAARPDLLLLLGHRLLLYEAQAGGWQEGRELRTDRGRGLAEALREAGAAGQPLGLAAEVQPRRLLVSDTTGALWQVPLGQQFALGMPRRLTAHGQPLTFPPPVRLALGDLEGSGSAVLVAAGEGRVWLVRRRGEDFAAPVLVADGLCSPDGVAAGELAPAVLGNGRIALGTRWGTLCTARLSSKGLVVEGWLWAQQAPLDVGLCAAPASCDWNADGREDLLVAGADGRLRLFLRRPDQSYEPGLVVHDARGPIQSPTAQGWSCCFPALADLDGDGDLDLLLGQVGGKVGAWCNQGHFVSQPPVTAGQAAAAHAVAVPMPVDWDRDGDLDLFVGCQPLPADLLGEPRPASNMPPMYYLENDAGPGRWPSFEKAVVVDFLAGGEGGWGDAAYLQPWQLLFPARLQVGAEVLVSCREGIFPFRLASKGPAYPRLLLPVAGEAVRPLRARGLAWAVRPGPAGAGLLVGLGAYGWVCTFSGASAAP